MKKFELISKEWKRIFRRAIVNALLIW